MSQEYIDPDLDLDEIKHEHQERLARRSDTDAVDDTDEEVVGLLYGDEEVNRLLYGED